MSLKSNIYIKNLTKILRYYMKTERNSYFLKNLEDHDQASLKMNLGKCKLYLFGKL